MLCDLAHFNRICSCSEPAVELLIYRRMRINLLTLCGSEVTTTTLRYSDNERSLTDDWSTGSRSEPTNYFDIGQVWTACVVCSAIEWSEVEVELERPIWRSARGRCVKFFVTKLSRCDWMKSFTVYIFSEMCDIAFYVYALTNYKLSSLHFHTHGIVEISQFFTLDDTTMSNCCRSLPSSALAVQWSVKTRWRMWTHIFVVCEDGDESRARAKRST